MGGLLYKDFVSVNKIGKIKLTWLMAALTIIYIVLRIVFPGTKEIQGFLALNEQGETVNILDTFFVIFFALWIIAGLGIINGFIGKIVDGDDKNEIRGYLSAMPFSKNTYVASKFIFIGIAGYVFLSVNCIWGVSCMAFCMEGYALGMAKMIMGFIMPLMSLIFLSAAIELPLFLLLGKEKAQTIKVGIWLVIAFIAIGYIMFGDFTWLIGHINIGAIMSWVDMHQTEVTLLQAFSPVIILVLYYVSYRATCHFAGEKEA